jgi:Family of unknown function (DUF6299)
MRLMSKIASVCAAILVSTFVTLPANAAPPSADTIGGAITASLGTTRTLNTTQATTDSVDAGLNANCGAPATDASVWYKLTLSSDSGVIVDVSASTYSAGVIVASGSPGALTLVTCGPTDVVFGATANTTYYVLAFDYQGDGGGNGGTLSITFTAAPLPPTLALTVAPTGTFNSKTGSATLGGTYTCTNASVVIINGEVSQAVGRVATIRGVFDFFLEGTCDGKVHRWTAEATPSSGKFKGGKSLVVSLGAACGDVQCTSAFKEQLVKLSGGGK